MIWNHSMAYARMVPVEIKRNVFNKLYNEMSEPKISILLGARQVGKTTLLHQLKAQAQRDGQKTAFFDLEQTADLRKLSGEPDQVIQTFLKSGQVIFIDEFHYLKNASKIFKEIYDAKQPIKIFASGSSSLEIHKHLKESLAGRFRRTKVFPLSIDEWQQINSFRPENFLVWGGLPQLSQEKNAVGKLETLENILNTYLLKDIKALIKEENLRAFNHMLYQLAQSQGSIVSQASLSREVGITESSISRYIDIMAQTYVLHPLPSFSQNLGNELKKAKKFYLYDLGIRNMLLKNFQAAPTREDREVLLETAVALHIIPQLKPNMELRFWRTKKGDEVDFIVLKNQIPVPIEVKSSLASLEIPKSLKKFLIHYPQAPFGIVFNQKQQGEVSFQNKKVFFQTWVQSNCIDYLQEVL